jgi:AraC-like DNA-binding protein
MSSRLEFVRDWEVLARQAGFRPSELAELCQTSLRTLERHFQRNYGVTVSQWLRDFRLKQAYQSLQEGKTVKETAYDHGYKQMSHFSREFKNQFGMSPSFLSAPHGRSQRTVSYRQVSPSSPQMIFSF